MIRVKLRGEFDMIFVFPLNPPGVELNAGDLLFDEFVDDWDESQPIDGGLAPPADRYEPQRGFGKVWREHPEIRERAGMRVSAHLLIRRDGEVVQFVSFNERAWHAGRSSWQGREACNDYSIGIECEGTDEVPYTAEQYAALRRLLPMLLETYPAITPDRIVGHSDVAPGRKTDPGPSFDWQKVR